MVESKNPADNPQGNPEQQTEQPLSERTFDPRDLVYKEALDKDPREVVSEPAVAPQTNEDVDDLRSDRQFD